MVEKELKKKKLSVKQARALVFGILSKKDPVAAKKYRDKYGIYVRTSRETFEPWEREKIKKSLLKETKISESQAKKVAEEVEEKIKELNPKYISSSLIREMVNQKLLEMDLEDIRREYVRVGLPVYDIDQLVSKGSKENANLQYNPETIHKLMADEMERQWVLTKVLPQHLSDAHIKGIIHIHDLDYWIRPFCFSHDLRYFLKHGYNADGTGFHSSSAKPSKHPEVAILHAAKILASAQTNCAGGQGYNWFNVILAPYIQGLDYKKIKQLAQMFLFEMSQMYVARGGQTVFSSIDLYPTIPKILENVPVVLPGGIVKEGITYSDFADETQTFFNAFMDVYTEGDGLGKPFNFPKCEVVVRPEWLNKYEEEYRKVSALAAKFGTPYYFIQQPYMPEYACYQCCAFLMPLSEQNTDDDLYDGSVRGGALQVVTINLPRIGYEADGDDKKLFELIRERMELAKEVLLIKNKTIKKVQNNGLLPFLSQPVRDKKYLDVDSQSLTIGMVGLNEMLKAHIGEELHESVEAWKFGLKIFNYMKEIVIEFSKETGLNFSLARTPAESCAYRLASIDLKEFGSKAIVQGDPKTNSVYYTNSMHVRPSADIPLIERIKREAAFHAILTGGAMSHVWMKESNPNVEALNKFTKNIVNKTLMGYFAYTKDFSICKNCKAVTPGLLDNCPQCGGEVDWFSRITGYYQAVSGWNKGKLAELKDRRRYGL